MSLLLALQAQETPSPTVRLQAVIRSTVWLFLAVLLRMEL